MQGEELIKRLLDHARYGELNEFLEVTKGYFISIGENSEAPSDESIRNLYRITKTKEGTTVLHYASANDHKHIIDLFIGSLSKDDLNNKNDEGSTALHWAAFNGSLDCVSALAEAGADLNLKNAQGRSAMTLAELQGHSNVADEILRRVDINKENCLPIENDEDDVLCL